MSGKSNREDTNICCIQGISVKETSVIEGTADLSGGLGKQLSNVLVSRLPYTLENHGGPQICTLSEIKTDPLKIFMY